MDGASPKCIFYTFYRACYTLGLSQQGKVLADSVITASNFYNFHTVYSQYSIDLF